MKENQLYICENADKCDSTIKGVCGHNKPHEQKSYCINSCPNDGNSKGSICTPYTEPTQSEKDLLGYVDELESVVTERFKKLKKKIDEALSDKPDRKGKASTTVSGGVEEYQLTTKFLLVKLNCMPSSIIYNFATCSYMLGCGDPNIIRHSHNNMPIGF